MTIRYPRELREAALRDILSKTLTLKEIGEKYTVCRSTLKYWLRQEKNGAKAGVMSEPKPTDKKPADRLVLPKGWSLKQAHAVITLVPSQKLSALIAVLSVSRLRRLPA